MTSSWKLLVFFTYFTGNMSSLSPGVSLMLMYTGTLRVGLSYGPAESHCPPVTYETFGQSWIEMGVSGRSMLTVPPGYKVDWSSIPGAGMGAFTTTFVPRYTWLGEYEGIFKTAGNKSWNDYTNDYTWALYKYGRISHFVDAQDESYANWLRYVNCARHRREEGARPVPCRGRMYYVTQRDMPPGVEILVSYGGNYMVRLGINVSAYYSDDP